MKIFYKEWLLKILDEDLLASEDFGESQRVEAKMRAMLGNRKRPEANILVDTKKRPN